MRIDRKTIEQFRQKFISKDRDSVIKANIAPGQDATYDLGTPVKQFKNVYAQNFLGGGLIDDHGALNGLGDDDHTQYVHISIARNIAAQHQFAPSVAQPPFSLNVNAQGETVIGFRADQLNKSVIAGTALSGGGALTSTITINADLAVSELPTGIRPDNVGAVGSSEKIARADHVHGVLTTTPGPIYPDDTAFAGTANYLVRSDHRHAIYADPPSFSLSATSANSEGTSNAFSRADHEHQITWSAGPTLGTAWILGVNTNGELDLLGDFSVDIDTLYIDVSEDAIYVNAGVLPSRRGALTVHPAVDSQQGLVIEQNSATQTAHLLRVYDSSGNDLILLNNVGDLESGNPNFVSGLTGWQITHDGNAEFNNIVARGELHASIFVADEMHATGGTFAVMTSVKVAEPFNSGDNELPAIDSQFTLNLQASWDTGLSYVAVDDVVRFKFMTKEPLPGQNLDLYDVYVEVDVVGSTQDRDMTNGNPGWIPTTVTLRQGGATGIIIPTGTGGAVWGTLNTLTGGIILTSDLSLSPYIDIFTNEGASPWLTTGIKPRVRVGNLDGVLSLTEQWGIAMGTDLSDDTKPYIIASDQQLSLKDVVQNWYDAGSNHIGQIDPSATGSDPWFWLGPSASDKKFEMRADGNLLLRGSLVVGPNIGYYVGDGFMYLPFDGTEPFSQDFQIDLASHKGAKPDYRVAVIGREGKFGKAAQIAKATTNLVKYPSFEVGNPPTGWGVLDCTFTRSSRHKFGSYSGSMSVNNPGSTPHVNTTLDNIDLSLDYVISGWAFVSSVSSGDAALRLQRTDTFVVLCSVAVDMAKKGEWQRVQAKYTGTGGSTSTPARIQLVGAPTDVWVVYWDGIQVEQNDHVTPYADGSMGSGHTWSGTENQSTSNRSASNFYYRYSDIDYDITDGIRIGTISCWVYGDNWDYPGTSGRWVFADNASNGNFDLYLRPSNIICRANGATAVSYSGAIPTSEWIHIALTWDFWNLECALYLNGVQVSTGSWPSITLGTVLRIGTSSSASGQIDGFIDDFLWLYEELTPNAIMQIYESGAPIQVSSSGFELMLTGNDRGKVYGHSAGLFGVTPDGTASFALLNDDLSTWGGFSSLGQGDLIMGHNKSGSTALFWDKSSGKLGIYSHGAPDADIEFSAGGDLIARRFQLRGNWYSGDTDPRLNLMGTTGQVASVNFLSNEAESIRDMRLDVVTSPSDTTTARMIVYPPGTSTGYHASLYLDVREGDTGGGYLYIFGNVLVGANSGNLPSGGFKGRGTINAKALYDDGVQVSDFVFEDDYSIMPIDEMAEYMYEKKRLPTIPGRDEWEDRGGFSLGKISNHLWETVEVHAVYLDQLHQRIKELENRLATYQR